MKHTARIVDGILLNYHCEPCPECLVKLEAAEGMAKQLEAVIFAITIDKFTQNKAWLGLKDDCKAALALGQKAGKGET